MMSHGDLSFATRIGIDWDLLQVLIQDGLVSDLEVLVLRLSLVVDGLGLVWSSEGGDHLRVVQLLVGHVVMAVTDYEGCWSSPLVLHLLHLALDRRCVLKHHSLRVSSQQACLICTANQG